MYPDAADARLALRGAGVVLLASGETRSALIGCGAIEAENLKHSLSKHSLCDLESADVAFVVKLCRNSFRSA